MPPVMMTSGYRSNLHEMSLLMVRRRLTLVVNPEPLLFIFLEW